MQRNEIIKDLLRRLGIKQWELAAAHGTSEMSLSRELRNEISLPFYLHLIHIIQTCFKQCLLDGGVCLLVCERCGATQMVITYYSTQNRHPSEIGFAALSYMNEAGWIPSSAREDDCGMLCPKCAEAILQNGGGDS